MHVIVPPFYCKPIGQFVDVKQAIRIIGIMEKTDKITEKKTSPFNMEEALTRLEFHRDALALLPDREDKRPGIAFLVAGDGDSQATRSCTCALAKTSTCPHILELMEVYKGLDKRMNKKSLHDDSKSNIWHSLAEFPSEGNQVSLERIRVKTHEQGRDNYSYSRHEDILDHSAKTKPDGQHHEGG